MARPCRGPGCLRGAVEEIDGTPCRCWGSGAASEATQRWGRWVGSPARHWCSRRRTAHGACPAVRAHRQFQCRAGRTLWIISAGHRRVCGGRGCVAFCSRRSGPISLVNSRLCMGRCWSRTFCGAPCASGPCAGPVVPPGSLPSLARVNPAPCAVPGVAAESERTPAPCPCLPFPPIPRLRGCL